MSDNQNIPEVGTQIPRNAVSIYGHGDAMDDFPVLKAFQQYVDAEHAKAQKRMTTLCIFFVVLMVALVGVFVMLLMNISSRNSALSDQLFQVMLKDRDRQNVIVQPPAPVQQNDGHALLALQKQLFEQQMKIMEETLKARGAASGAAAAVPGEPVPMSERAEFRSQVRAHEQLVKAQTAKLQKANDMIKTERERLAKEKEILRQKEIELQKRKLYPDYYAKETSQRMAAPAPVQAAPQPMPEGDDDDFAHIDAAIEAEERNVSNTPKNQLNAPVKYFDAAAVKDDVDELVESIDSKDTRKQAPKISDTTEWSMPLE